MKKNLLILIALFPIMLVAQPVDEFQQFNGRYDFTAFGNTLNLEENGLGGACDILTSSSADLMLLPTQTLVSAHLYWAGSGNEWEMRIRVFSQKLTEKGYKKVRRAEGQGFIGLDTKRSTTSPF